MLQAYQADLGAAPRLARWAELRGRPDEARRLLREAGGGAGRRHGMPREQLAWFHLRLGDLALRTGHLREAEHELDAGLAILPGDYRLLGTLARLEAARHQWRRAAETGELAVSRALDPATLGLLSDAWDALGDTARSNQYARAMALSVLRQPGAYHRAWSLYLLDHGRDVPAVLANVRRELETRHDIYGLDLLAWALHRSGRDREAHAPMAQALALGTQDAMLYYHAGMIDLAAGDTAAARSRLERALAINPAWHPTQPARVRAVLDSLSR
jgi:tetratricopeptide (TPR) repeat protein